MKEAEILMGKLNYYSVLVLKGVRNRAFINNIVSRKVGHWDDRMVELDKETLKQVKWWRLNMMALFHGGSGITDPFVKFVFPGGAVEIFPDAAGVSEVSVTFKGLGVVELESGKWTMWKWPQNVIEEHGKELSLLEAGGALAGMLMAVEEISANGSVLLWVDNIGAVWASVNQSSRSLLVYTVVKAILDLADGMGVRVKLCHTGRRTGVGEKVADHLSKGEVELAKDLAGLKEDRRVKMSRVLGRWFSNLKPELDLGRRCILEVAARVEVYAGLDYNGL